MRQSQTGNAKAFDVQKFRHRPTYFNDCTLAQVSKFRKFNVCGPLSQTLWNRNKQTTECCRSCREPCNNSWLARACEGWVVFCRLKANIVVHKRLVVLQACSDYGSRASWLCYRVEDRRTELQRDLSDSVRGLELISSRIAADFDRSIV